MARRVLERRELVPALGEGQEEREEDRADEKPVAEHHLDGESPRHRPHDEAEGDREHVEDDDVLEDEGVREVEGEVRERAGEEAGAEAPGREQAEGQ